MSGRGEFHSIGLCLQDCFEDQLPLNLTGIFQNFGCRRAVQSDQKYFKVSSNEQLVPAKAEAVRSIESDQLLRINAVVGG